MQESLTCNCYKQNVIVSQNEDIFIEKQAQTAVIELNLAQEYSKTKEITPPNSYSRIEPFRIETSHKFPIVTFTNKELTFTLINRGPKGFEKKYLLFNLNLKQLGLLNNQPQLLTKSQQIERFNVEIKFSLNFIANRVAKVDLEAENKIDLPSNKLSLHMLTKMKNLAVKFLKFRFCNQLEYFTFNYFFKYTFTTNTSEDFSTTLTKNKTNKALDQIEYTIKSPQKDIFSVYCSVYRIFLGEYELPILYKEEIRSEDDDSIIETKIQIRDFNICTARDLQLVIQTDNIIDGDKRVEYPVDDKYIHTCTRQSYFKKGKFTLTILRLLRQLNEEYQNKQIIPDIITVKLTYNHQEFKIYGWNYLGLYEGGLFPSHEFYINNIEDNILVQIYVKHILVAEASICPAIVEDRFIQEIPQIYYVANDLYYHFIKSLQIREVYIMGLIKYEECDWTKLFIKMKDMQINLNSPVCESYYLHVTGDKYDWKSEIFHSNEKQTKFNFSVTDVIEYIIPDKELEYKLLFTIYQGDNVLVEKQVSLKPFIKREGINIDFKFNLGTIATINTSIEINGIFKNEMIKQIQIPKLKFDPKKLAYQDFVLMAVQSENTLLDAVEEKLKNIKIPAEIKMNPQVQAQVKVEKPPSVAYIKEKQEQQKIPYEQQKKQIQQKYMLNKLPW